MGKFDIAESHLKILRDLCSDEADMSDEFNRKGGRHGHLFQGRFKAILIDADVYLN